jgi:hypothetical protein
MGIHDTIKLHNQNGTDSSLRGGEKEGLLLLEDDMVMITQY